MRKLPILALGIALVGCASVTPTEQPAQAYGATPTEYDQIIRRYFEQSLKDPDSVQYRDETRPETGYIKTGGLLNGHIEYGWLVHVDVNAKNSYGGYTGFKTYAFLFRGNVIVDELLPPSD